jgi:RNA polymerase sigma factor (sigma-70 family)
MEITDEELVADCRNGDNAAWETLVKRYRRLIYAIPRRAGLDEDDSGEIFQQVFAILVKSLDRISDPSKIQAWLVTTSKRETTAFLKKQNRIRQFSGADDDNEEIDEITNLVDERILPDEAIVKLETQNRVRLAVESLDEKCRRLLEMLFYNENPPPYSEIAEILGIREGSIGPTRARCLKKTLDKLSE